ncbi:MAG TPA: chromate transporter [Candidatus Limnocylindria bacterium]|nr:chromate transporter [Candidatus Limnocylindria bacterium]
MSSPAPEPAPEQVTVPQIFRAFLLIGATSFGGGVVAYLRSSLVEKHRWIDDRTFVEFLAIGQTLPGLNATNMSVLVGDRLRGAVGAAVAVIGMCLPGALLMFAAGVAFGIHGNRTVVVAMLHGVAAAATGLVFALTVQIGKKALGGIADLVFVLGTAAAVSLFHVKVFHALLVLGAISIWWHRPRGDGTAAR